jgi:hypothetical protein
MPTYRVGLIIFAGINWKEFKKFERFFLRSPSKDFIPRGGRRFLRL